MVNYFIRCQIFSIAENYFYVSAVAVPAGAPRQGVISRYHECQSMKDSEDFLEILRDQVLQAVRASGGLVIGENSSVLSAAR